MKKMWKYIMNNVPICIEILLVLAISCVLIIKNCRDNTFYKANLVNIATLIIAGIITVAISDRNNRRNRRNDCIEHLVLEIEKMVSDDSAFSKNDMALIVQQSCGNRIKYLKEAGFKDIDDDVEFISTHFEELRLLYSENSQNDAKLNGVKETMQRLRSNISDKCNKIRVSLYT